MKHAVIGSSLFGLASYGAFHFNHPGAGVILGLMALAYMLACVVNAAAGDAP